MLNAASMGDAVFIRHKLDGGGASIGPQGGVDPFHPVHAGRVIKVVKKIGKMPIFTLMNFVPMGAGLWRARHLRK